MATNSFIKAYKWASSYNKEDKKNIILTARETGESLGMLTASVFMEVTMLLRTSYTGELHISISSRNSKANTSGCS
jgi:hypothetical protein